MIEFEVRVHDEHDNWLHTYELGPSSLAMEIDNLPVGWTLSVKRWHPAADAPSESAKAEDYVTERSQ